MDVKQATTLNLLDEQERQKWETAEQFGRRLFALMSARQPQQKPLPKRPSVSS